MTSPDLDIAGYLADLGYDIAEAAAIARPRLEAAGLTRPGKLRMAAAKADQARDVLATSFIRCCAEPACLTACQKSAAGRELVTVGKSSCESCHGSANRRAVVDLAALARVRGVSRILVVGGTPILHRELEDLLGQTGEPLAMRFVDGETGIHTKNDAAHQLKWAEVLVIWASTPLPHKVSTTFTNNPLRSNLKLVTVTQRGIKSLCEQVARLL